jgi:spore germination protein
MLKIKKKTFVLIVSYLGAAVLYLGGWTVGTYATDGNYADTAKYGYSHAFAEVVTAVDDLNDTLRRCAFAAGDDMTEALCARAYGDCLGAQMTMAALPFSTAEMEQTAGFLGRAGDYAASLCRTAPENGGFTEKERQTLSKLSDTASVMAEKLSALRGDIDSGKVIMDDPENAVRTRTAEYKNSDTLSAAMLSMENAFPEQQELRYDGKYTYKTADAAQGDIVSVEQAKRNASEFLGLSEERIKLRYISQSGPLRYYLSAGVPDGEGNVITAGDGRVRSFIYSRAVPAGKMSLADGEKAAEAFLASRGYKGLTLVSGEKSGGAAVCRFVPVQGGVRCLPDVIKISIALDNGGVCAFDASEYQDNHRTRAVPAGLLPESGTRGALVPGLTAADRGLCVLQTAGGGEAWCREYACTDKNGTECAVYVNAVTGKQQELKLS